MEKNFRFEEKESYTSTEVKGLLEQHSKFIKKGMVAKEDYDKLNEEYQPLKEAHDKAEFRTNMESKLSKHNIKDIDKVLKYGGFSAEDDEKTIKEKIGTIKKDLPHLFEEDNGLKKDDFKQDNFDEGKLSSVTVAC